MKKRFFLLFCCVIIYASVSSQVSTPEQATDVLHRPENRQHFIENKGQWPAEVLFMTRLNGLNA